MFLMQLKENEKKVFLKLAQHIMEVNISEGEKENAILLAYANEMGIDVEKFNEDEFDLDEVLLAFKNKTSKKIVLLEIMALIYADNQVDEEEEKFIQSMCSKFEISRAQAQIYEEWTKAMLALYKQGELFINV